MLHINRRRAFVRAGIAALLAAVALAGPVTAQAQTIGQDLIARQNIDDFRGFVLISPFSFGAESYGKSLTSVSIYSDRVGYSFTPLVLDWLGGTTFKVAAIGTLRTVGSAGQHTYAFGSVSGSAVIGENTRFAWMTPSGQTGVIPFNSDASGYFYTSNGIAVSSVGEMFETNAPIGRAYSIQFTVAEATTTVPEPQTWALMASGLVAMGIVARRRRTAA